MDKTFKIGDFSFRLTAPDTLPIPDNFRLFETRDTPEHTYALEFTDRIPQPDGPILARRPDLLVFSTEVGEGRLMASRGLSALYASYREETPSLSGIYVNPQAMSLLSLDPAFVSLFALERKMLDHDALILHCAYIVHNGEAILFSAPSGVGKSTQASLWERYRGARTINGDRCLLRKIGGRWHASPWPVCGSSGICRLGDFPIRAIVMLAQAPRNEAAPLPPARAFSELYAQITVNQWNPAFVTKTMTLLEDLVSSLRVFRLRCDISEAAVQELERVLNAATDP